MPDRPLDIRVGVIGLGGIGAGAVRGLRHGGFETTIYDLQAGVRTALAAETGARAVDSVAGAAEDSDVLLVAVWDDKQVREVIAGPLGVLEAAQLPRVVVILSTTTVETIHWAEGILAPRGAAAVDCGVAGGVKALASGAIVAMAGGDAASLDFVGPILGAFADPVIPMGPLGSGMAAKLARNMITYAERVVVWEAINLAAASGVEPSRFVDVIKATDRWNTHTALLDRGFLPSPHASGDPVFAAQAAAYAHKDLGVAAELAGELGVTLDLAAVADEFYDAAVAIEPASRDSV
jgi:3-hydroxyisobutyrate dehydrogenase-like beta-hydroxyacid dehydrogenase